MFLCFYVAKSCACGQGLDVLQRRRVVSLPSIFVVNGCEHQASNGGLGTLFFGERNFPPYELHTSMVTNDLAAK
jgi:hypothetical protein